MRRENLPTTDEVSIILQEEYGSAGFRDIVLVKRINGDDDDANPFTLLNSNHGSYLPHPSVLLFPYSEPGWYRGRTLNNCEENIQNKNLSQWTFYSFCLHTRSNEPLTLFHAEKLFQQFVVAAEAVCDQNKLRWIH